MIFSLTSTLTLASSLCYGEMHAKTNNFRKQLSSYGDTHAKRSLHSVIRLRINYKTSNDRLTKRDEDFLVGYD